MALWLCFTSPWGWPCSACGVVSPPEEGYTFFPAPSLPPRLHLLLCKLTFSYPCLIPVTALFTLFCLKLILTFFQRSKAEVQSLLRLDQPFGHTGGCCHQGSHLFAGSVTALPLKWNVFCINSNIVTLRSRALLRGGFNPIIRGRYTWKYVNSGWSWVAYILPMLCPFRVSQKWRKDLKIFFPLNTPNTKVEDSDYVYSQVNPLT